MMWEELMVRVIEHINTDSVLTMLYGGNIRKARGDSEIETPLLEYNLISDVEEELWNPIVIQFDQWQDTADAVRHSEQRLRFLFHSDMPLTLDGVQFFSVYLDGEVLTDENRDGFSGRAIRFRFTPLRRNVVIRQASSDL